MMVFIGLVLITSFDLWAIHTVTISGNTLTRLNLAHISLPSTGGHPASGRSQRYMTPAATQVELGDFTFEMLDEKGRLVLYSYGNG
jgi:hypothetical protein